MSGIISKDKEILQGLYSFATLEMMSEAKNKSAPKMTTQEKIWKKEVVWTTIYSLD